MKQSKINKFIEDRELAIDLYNNTSMKVSEISRLIKRSKTTVDHMITGKLPKYVSGINLTTKGGESEWKKE
jgi:hypothetical protein